MINILVVTIKPWNVDNFFKLKEQLNSKYNFYLIEDRDKFTYKNIEKISPKYIFFPHWSWRIPEKIYKNFKCIIFHETKLPYGRGGSPIQNLIINKQYSTVISAIECVEEIDAGDIYTQEEIDISQGSVTEIFEHISNIIFFKMIPDIIDGDLKPMKQVGEATVFKRRKPEESNIVDFKPKDLIDLYDFIRMVDSQHYPRAFLNIGNLKIEFSDVKLKDGELVGVFKAKKVKNE